MGLPDSLGRAEILWAIAASTILTLLAGGTPRGVAEGVLGMAKTDLMIACWWRVTSASVTDSV